MRYARMAVVVGFATGSLMYGQENPMSTEAQQSWTRTKNNLLAAAEKMPKVKTPLKAGSGEPELP